MSDSKTKKDFKYWRSCKLPTCGKEFGTNRKWQEFCPKKPGERVGCQQEYHKLLRRKHEDVIVELAVVTERQAQLIEITTAIIETINYIINSIQKISYIIGYIPKETPPEIPEIKEIKKKRPARNEQN